MHGHLTTDRPICYTMCGCLLLRFVNILLKSWGNYYIVLQYGWHGGLYQIIQLVNKHYAMCLTRLCCQVAEDGLGA